MEQPLFDIIFHGQLVAGSDVNAVKNNLMQLFKIDEARATSMLSGKPVTLKRNADQATTMRFRAALKQAGALCEVVPLAVDEPEQIIAMPAVEPTPTASAAPAIPTASSQATTAEDGGSREMVGTIRTGGEGFSGEFSVAPVGADMADEKPETGVVVPDISHLSMAPVGSDMGQKPREPAPPAPDTSGLSLAND